MIYRIYVSFAAISIYRHEIKLSYLLLTLQKMFRLLMHLLKKFHSAVTFICYTISDIWINISQLLYEPRHEKTCLWVRLEPACAAAEAR